MERDEPDGGISQRLPHGGRHHSRLMVLQRHVRREMVFFFCAEDVSAGPGRSVILLFQGVPIRNPT